MTGSVRLFQIAGAAEVLEDLRQRLESARWPDQLAWDYGTDTVCLRELATYWCDGFGLAARRYSANAGGSSAD